MITNDDKIGFQLMYIFIQLEYHTKHITIK